MSNPSSTSRLEWLPWNIFTKIPPGSVALIGEDSLVARAEKNGQFKFAELNPRYNLSFLMCEISINYHLFRRGLSGDVALYEGDSVEYLTKDADILVEVRMNKWCFVKFTIDPTNRFNPCLIRWKTCNSLREELARVANRWIWEWEFWATTWKVSTTKSKMMSQNGPTWDLWSLTMPPTLTTLAELQVNSTDFTLLTHLLTTFPLRLGGGLALGGREDLPEGQAN